MVRAPARSFGPVAGLYSAGRGFAPPGSTKPAARSSPSGSRSLPPSLAHARCALRLRVRPAKLVPNRRRGSVAPLPSPAALPNASLTRIAAFRVASLRRRLRSPSRPSAARGPPRARNRLGADAPAPLLALSPDIARIGYRRRLIALRAISPHRARRFAPARSERVAAFPRSRGIRHGLRSLSPRQLTDRGRRRLKGCRDGRLAEQRAKRWCVGGAGCNGRTRDD